MVLLLRSGAIPSKVFASSHSPPQTQNVFRMDVLMRLEILKELHPKELSLPLVPSSSSFSLWLGLFTLNIAGSFARYMHMYACFFLTGDRRKEEGEVFKLNSNSLPMSYIALNVGVYQKTLKFPTSPPLIISFSQHKPIKCGFPTQYIHPGTDT